MPKPEYRAQFDATVTFSNGGELSARDFRVDVPHAEVSAAEVGALFVASLSLLMVDRVEVTQAAGIPGAAQGHPLVARPTAPAHRLGRRAWVELSHPIEAGMVTYPGLPAPWITPHLTRAASRAACCHRPEPGSPRRRRGWSASAPFPSAPTPRYRWITKTLLI